MNYYTSADLYHHGILGMEWGKRNGPPYPLGVSDHSASEKKAGWRKSLDPSQKGTTGLKLTDKQKKALKIGATAAGVALLAVGTIYLTKSGRLNALADTGKQMASSLLGSKIAKTPISEIPKIDIPKVDVPKIDVPKVDIPKVDVPKIDASTVSKQTVDAARTFVQKAPTSYSTPTIDLGQDYANELLKKNAAAMADWEKILYG